MGWAVAIPAIANVASAALVARSNSSSSRNATNATNNAANLSLDEQKRIFDLQRQDELAARARRLAVAGERRQLIMGDDGKMRLGPQMKTLGDYSVSGINPPAMPPGPVNQNFTATPLGAYGGGDGMDKAAEVDSQLAGATPSDSAMTDSMTNPRFVHMEKAGQRRMVNTDNIAKMMQQGWVMSSGGF